MQSRGPHPVVFHDDKDAEASVTVIYLPSRSVAMRKLLSVVLVMSASLVIGAIGKGMPVKTVPGPSVTPLKVISRPAYKFNHPDAFALSGQDLFVANSGSGVLGGDSVT